MNRETVRRIDEIAISEYGMSGIVLMENAGRGATERLIKWIWSTLGPDDQAEADRPIRILCGRGNNGGDGYVIGRHLEIFGFRPHLISVAELSQLSGDAAINASIAQAAQIPIDVVHQASEIESLIQAGDTVVDCLLGTGSSGAPRGIFADVIRHANQLTGRRVAIDLPSGLDCDTGKLHQPTFRADLTITFVDMKDGFFQEDAQSHLGLIEVVGIGVPQHLLERFRT